MQGHNFFTNVLYFSHFLISNEIFDILRWVTNGFSGPSHATSFKHLKITLFFSIEIRDLDTSHENPMIVQREKLKADQPRPRGGGTLLIDGSTHSLGRLGYHFGQF